MKWESKEVPAIKVSGKKLRRFFARPLACFELCILISDEKSERRFKSNKLFIPSWSEAGRADQRGRCRGQSASEEQPL